MRIVLLLALALGVAAGTALVLAVEPSIGTPRRYYDFPDGGANAEVDAEADARRREQLERDGAWMRQHPGLMRVALFGVGALPVALGVGVVGGAVVAVKRAKARRRAG